MLSKKTHDEGKIPDLQYFILISSFPIKPIKNKLLSVMEYFIFTFAFHSVWQKCPCPAST